MHKLTADAGFLDLMAADYWHLENQYLSLKIVSLIYFIDSEINILTKFR